MWERIISRILFYANGQQYISGAEPKENQFPEDRRIEKTEDASEKIKIQGAKNEYADVK